MLYKSNFYSITMGNVVFLSWVAYIGLLSLVLANTYTELSILYWGIFPSLLLSFLSYLGVRYRGSIDNGSKGLESGLESISDNTDTKEMCIAKKLLEK